MAAQVREVLFRYQTCKCGWQYLPAPGGGGYCRWCKAALKSTAAKEGGAL